VPSSRFDLAIWGYTLVATALVLPAATWLRDAHDRRCAAAEEALCAYRSQLQGGQPQGEQAGGE
jgi:hypothetical protein